MANFYIAIFLHVAVFSNYVNGKSWVIPENWSPSQSGQISRSTDLTKALEFVTRAESEMHEAAIKMTNLDWNYESNITDETEAIKLEYKVMFYPLDIRNTKKTKMLCFHKQTLYFSQIVTKKKPK